MVIYLDKPVDQDLAHFLVDFALIVNVVRYGLSLFTGTEVFEGGERVFRYFVRV